MSEINNITLTDAGRTVLAKAIAGKTLKFSRVSCGDGILTEYQDAKKLEGLVNELHDLKIYSCEVVSSGGVAELQASLTNKNLESSFFVREVGIFVEEPDTGEEILYGYCALNEENDYMPARGGTEDTEFVYKFYIAIGQAENITINCDSGIVYVSQKELAEIFADSATIKEFWVRTEGDNRKLRPAGISPVRVAIMGIEDLGFLQEQINELAEADVQNAVSFWSMLEEIPRIGVKNTLDGNETDQPPSVHAVKEAIRTIELTPGPQGPKGDKGDKGDTGPQGPKGDSGDGSSKAEDWTFTLKDGSIVVKSILLKDLGGSGTMATIKIGSVTTGAAGSEASVTNSGTDTDVILNFIIPRGATGPQGPKGDKGDAGSVDLSGYVKIGNATKEGVISGAPSDNITYGARYYTAIKSPDKNFGILICDGAYRTVITQQEVNDGEAYRHVSIDYTNIFANYSRIFFTPSAYSNGGALNNYVVQVNPGDISRLFSSLPIDVIFTGMTKPGTYEGHFMLIGRASIPNDDFGI